MKSTVSFAAKRALFDALIAKAGAGMPLDGTQVTYDYPARDLTRKVIYGGGFRWTHTDAAGEWGEVGTEVITVSLYIRVLRVDAQVATVRDADADVEALADIVVGLFAEQPKLGGGMTWMGVASGQGDYAHPPDGPESVLSLQLLVGAVVT